jgi:multiple sugar transport system ATP-binding protein
VTRAEAERRVQQAAAILGLEDVLRKKPRTLSGGQRQRVAMGRAIVRSPQAFLMDEPLSNLDAKLRVEMRAEIARIQRDLSVTTLYVTHDQTEAVTMGDRVVVLRGGLLQQVDSPQALYDRPANLFVAEFIGSPAMNLVRSTIVRRNGSFHARFGPHELRLAEGLLASRPGLGSYEGRQVVLGIRPEDMEDAAIRPAPDGQGFSVVTDIREDLGAEVLIHFSVAGDAVRSDEVVEAREAEGGVEEMVERGRTGVPFVARVDRASGAREGEGIDLWVDVSRLHFFDPATGLGIYGA